MSKQVALFDCGPEDCFFVGDSVKNDIVGARQAGIPAVLIDRGGHHEGVDAPRIRTLAELDAIIDR